MSKKALQIHPEDNLLVALTNLEAGEAVSVNGHKVTARQEIPSKHKLALKDLKAGNKIYMYGSLVGTVTEDVPTGGLLTTENTKHDVSQYSIKSTGKSWEAPDVSKWKDKEFLGYHRPDGQVGTANYWLVVPLVFCENRNVNTIKNAFMKELGYANSNIYEQYVSDLVELYKTGKTDQIQEMTSPPSKNELSEPEPIFENVDGIKFLTHEGGCGGIRQDSEALCGLLAGYIYHPNVAGATVLSLGCQNAQIEILEEKIANLTSDLQKPLYIYEQQQSGTEYEMLTSAIRKTFLGLVEANKNERKPAPLSKLTIGMECGGSDGFSGISANPSVGHAGDLVTALGGSVILSEFPELCGVEQELIDRTTTKEMAEKFVSLMRSYSDAAEASGSGFDMNPSPGNIKDGLITDAMKSAGAAKKGGTSPIQAVLDYTEYVRKPGLNLLCTPGNDVESTTAMAGSGANIILFTTGLGTPTGNPVAPVAKVSSNSELAKKMPDIIDIDTGPVIKGEKTIEEMGAQILDYIIDLASGNIKTKAMQLNQDDFIPWKRGVSL
ncbi:altronate dehydratase family protein [Aliifodinibius sp. S!AR15-10]|uniref:UxaA family hydrolase n=1 Tax=Aliifodinibius sp. S!AR15-10 TaxID=2950437 RepID=UPI0028662A74|nr:altronate dehydratase family protein [Aliifodinibius sp. S!AR15-10]MDR8394206.1 altronate dehydratase family protein [Aliifodinibius sp. S!AR15-10]